MGSGIIFNNGGGGGGTTINPTNNFIPKRSNATTFVDSVLENGSNYLYSNYGGYTGLGLDFLNFVSYLGDWNNLINGTTLVVNDQSSIIYTKYNGLVNGLILDFGSSFYELGDMVTKSSFVMDSIGQFAGIQIGSIPYFIADKNNNYVQIGDAAALVNCNFSSNLVEIGDFYSSVNGTIFSVNDTNYKIVSRAFGNEKGILIDFNNTNYYLGDFNGYDKNNYIHIEDGTNTTFFSSKVLNFINPNTSGASSGFSGLYLEVVIAGSLYKISLDNP